ncbi:MAG: adenine deaminase [Bacteroidota bacterium]
MKTATTHSGMIVDVIGGRIFPGMIYVESGKINAVRELRAEEVDEQYLLPGLVDAHVHVESSMLTPSEFARLAVTHGTVATVSDPHEIANVLGIKGVEFMIDDGKKVPLKFYFGAPSCVPATPFETSGAELSAEDIDILMQNDEVKYLAEMMNFPGVLNNDSLVMDKIRVAQRYQKPVDGHAPGLKGEEAMQYASAGISTDHECYTIDEARDKITAGMKVQIREGSAAKNFETLIPLLKEAPEQIMFCSDDKHPDELLEGHMNKLVKRSLDYGYDLIQALRPCTLNPKKHYHLQNGLLQTGDPADFVIIDHPDTFNVLQTYIDGVMVAEHGKASFSVSAEQIPNHFVVSDIQTADIEVKEEKGKLKVIDVKDGQLLTGKIETESKVENGLVVSDVQRDLLKIVVLNRYKPSKPAVGFIHNTGLKEGAMVSTVAHDSHNIVAVGVTDQMILKAINLVMESKGGIGYVNDKGSVLLPLPVAGIMSNQKAEKVAADYKKLDHMVKNAGSKLVAPFMSLSFMALLVIPALKMSDLGLFDGTNFKFTPLIEQ